MSEDETRQNLEITRLKKINQALITRIEAGTGGHAAYDQFAHSVFLADTVRDRTAALNQAMQQLQQANASRAQLMAAISHDIMQPVCAAQLLLENLIEHPSQKANQQQLPAVASAVSDIEHLLQGLLDYARQDVEHTEFNLQPTNLHELLHTLAAESAPMAKRKGLKVRYQPSSCWVLTDANLLARVLRNLISNAIRYTPSGTILIGVRRRHNSALVQVCDSGIGMKEEVPEQIFEPFEKLANHHNTEGLGLGLANVKNLCQMLNHDIHYESELGKGSSFSVGMARCNKAPVGLATSLTNGTIPFKQKVMVIDNSKQVCEALSLLLESWGSQVVSCSQIEEVTPEQLEWADIVVVDFHLDNGLTGLELVAKLDITGPIVFITASHDKSDLDAIAEANHTYLHKPIRPGRLRRILENLVS